MIRRFVSMGLLVVLGGCGPLTPVVGDPLDPTDSGTNMTVEQGSDAGSESSDAGTAADAGALGDAGVLADAGTEVELDAGTGAVGDAGTLSDAGTEVEVDAGTQVDAGTLEDGGMLTDAGVEADAGLLQDAGTQADAGVLCTTDSQCGGDACVFGRCATVTNTSFTYATQYSIEGVAVAYDDQSQPKVGWAYNDSAISGYSHFVALGPFGTRMNANTGLWSTASWDLTRRQGRAPFVAWVASYPGKYGITLGTGGGVIFNDDERVVSFSTSRNAAGDEFIAAILAVGATSTPACEVRFAQKPAGGAWSLPSTIHTCRDRTTGRIALHLLANGVPAILLSEEGAPSTLKILTQSSPLSWSARSLVTITGRPVIRLVQQRDGRSQVLLQQVTFSTSASNGDYAMSLLQLDDDQVTRTVSLGSFATQTNSPFLSFDVTADGTTYLLRNGTGTSNAWPVNVTRVDAATGAVTSQQLGTFVRGPYSRSAIGVSASGEIAVLHAENLRTMHLRRLAPR